MKRSPINRCLRNTFPTGNVICSLGLCAEESTSRARRPRFTLRKDFWLSDVKLDLLPQETLVAAGIHQRKRTEYAHQTMRLFVVRLVDKGKGSRSNDFALDKLQFRWRYPVRKKTPSRSHDEWLDQEPILIDQPRSHQRLH